MNSLFTLTESDFLKITKSLNFLMDSNNPLFLKKGRKQRFLRVESSETDDDGNHSLVMSGSEFELDADIPEDIYIRNGDKLISNIRSLTNPEISVIDNDDGGKDLLIKEGNYFSFTVGLSDESSMYKIHGNNQQDIDLHKKYNDIGISGMILETGHKSINFQLDENDLTKIKKFSNKDNDFLKFYVENNKIFTSNSDIETGHGFNLCLDEEVVLNKDIGFNISLTKLTKLPKDDFDVYMFYNDTNVTSVVFISKTIETSYFFPLMLD